jgi:hypothetical protein
VDGYELANRAALVGDLRIEEMRNESLGRYVRMARLVNVLRPREREALATLYDPTLIAMSPLAFTLSGFERTANRTSRRAGLFVLCEMSRKASHHVRESRDAGSLAALPRGRGAATFARPPFD